MYTVFVKTHYKQRLVLIRPTFFSQQQSPNQITYIEYRPIPSVFYINNRHRWSHGEY